MPTNIDTINLFSSKSININDKYSLQKTEVIQGQEGKRIKIENISAQMSVSSPGTRGTAVITAEVSGKLTTLETWYDENTIFTPHSETLSFLGEAGKDVNLRWNLLTSDPLIRSRIKLISYTYSYVDVEDITPCLVTVKFISKAKAQEFATSIKDQDVEVFYGT
jgi:hypothetical protein